MSYKPNKPDVQDKEVNYRSVIPMLTPEDIERKKQELENPDNITTRRLISIYMSNMMKLNQDWHPNIESVYKCYEYINDIVSRAGRGNNDVKEIYCIDESYCNYFLTTNPDEIKRIINTDMQFYNQLWRVKHTQRSSI